MMSWESEPVSDRQKVKLTFFGVRFSPNLTKADAHKLLDQINDPEREKAYRTYRDELDQKQAAEDDANIRLGAWQSSLEMRDLDYCRAISDEEVIDVLTYLDKTLPGWEKSRRLFFYDTLAQRHPDVLSS
jgi:hypothetical protein